MPGSRGFFCGTADEMKIEQYRSFFNPWVLRIIRARGDASGLSKTKRLQSSENKLS